MSTHWPQNHRKLRDACDEARVIVGLLRRMTERLPDSCAWTWDNIDSELRLAEHKLARLARQAQELAVEDRFRNQPTDRPVLIRKVG